MTPKRKPLRCWVVVDNDGVPLFCSARRAETYQMRRVCTERLGSPKRSFRVVEMVEKVGRRK